MTVTLDEAVEICKAEKKSGKIVSVGFQPRLDANMKMIKKIVESGELGRRVLHPDRRRPPPRHPGQLVRDLHRKRQRPASALWATLAAMRWIWC